MKEQPQQQMRDILDTMVGIPSRSQKDIIMSRLPPDITFNTNRSPPKTKPNVIDIDCNPSTSTK